MIPLVEMILAMDLMTSSEDYNPTICLVAHCIRDAVGLSLLNLKNLQST